MRRSSAISPWSKASAYLFNLNLCTNFACFLITAIFLIGLMPGFALACACGCGVFAVGTASLIPQGEGGTFWLEYDYMNQYLNWHATQIASAGRNEDKVLRSHFLTLGLQYMFNRKWGAMIEVPYTFRYFKTATDEGEGPVKRFNFSSVGDIRIQGIYTGLSEDMSTGLLGGIKVPSGWWSYPHAGRDVQIGYGSTDLLFGFYHIGTLPSHLGAVPLTLMDRPFRWYVQGAYDLPVFTQQQYKPGRELDAALGAIYDFGAVGPLKELAPMLTFLATDRVRDSLSNAEPQNTGYTRFLVAPGAEIRLGIVRLYGDVEVPIFQNVNGNQIISPVYFKTIASYDF